MNDRNLTTNHQDPLIELDPIQYRDIYHEDDVPLSNVRESASRYLLYGGLVILLLFILAGAITPISRTIKTRFTIENAIPEQSVRFFDDVYLLHSFVKPGQRVHAGEPLVQFNSVQVSSLLAAFQQAEQELMRFKEFQAPLHAGELRSLELQRERRSTEERQTQKLRTESESIYQAEQEKQRLILQKNFLNPKTRS